MYEPASTATSTSTVTANANPGAKSPFCSTRSAIRAAASVSVPGPWRNFYLSGAVELRKGVKDLPTPNTAIPDSVRAMGMTLFFDNLGMRLNGANAGDRCSTIVCVLPDLDETWTVTLGHGTLSHRKGADSNPEATLTIKRSDLGQVILGSKPLTEQLKGGQARIEGDVKALHDLIIDRLDNFEFWFDIVTP